MTNRRDGELAEQLPSLSYQLRWRDGGWVRTPVALPPPLIIDVASADHAVPPAATVEALLVAPVEQRLSAPREHLATFLRALARRLDYAGSAR